MPVTACVMAFSESGEKIKSGNQMFSPSLIIFRDHYRGRGHFQGTWRAVADKCSLVLNSIELQNKDVFTIVQV